MKNIHQDNNTTLTIKHQASSEKKKNNINKQYKTPITKKKRKQGNIQLQTTIFLNFHKNMI